ncbi:hypothetical protein [Ralstonia sp. UBA689]|uniref:hypothetical protein n=1 Tax=Ralstonia sp. UBA689 TaxID=1947373 RepID=UPI0025EE1FBD|nr:hypothetical protein [Ralstonia sp. UBA689]
MPFFERHEEWVAALLAGLVSGLAVATVWHFGPQKDFWDVLTALGTVGAAVVALLLANRDARRRKKEGWERAALAAASLSFRLSIVAVDVRGLHTKMREASQMDCAPSAFEEWQEHLSGLITFSMAEIEPLIPLGNCASAIASAQDRLVVARRLLTHYSSGGLDMSETRKTRAITLAAITGEASRLIDTACKECDQAARGAIWA